MGGLYDQGALWHWIEHSNHTLTDLGMGIILEPSLWHASEAQLSHHITSMNAPLRVAYFNQQRRGSERT